MRADVATYKLEVVRRSMDAIESGDRERLRSLVEETIHPECEWTPLIAVGLEGTYRGRDGMTTFFRDFRESFDPRYEEREVRPIGEGAVLLLCRLRLTGRESRLEIDQEMGAVFEFEDGLVRRGRAYPSHAEALSAAEALDA